MADPGTEPESAEEDETGSSSGGHEESIPGGQEEHENSPHMLVSFEENWTSEYGNPVRFCTEGDAEPGLVVDGRRSWFRNQVYFLMNNRNKLRKTLIKEQ
ncbi:hypothetical protein ACROYT_G034695 [Oculina patagonica]